VLHPAAQVGKLRTVIREKAVTSVVVDRTQKRYWAAALDRIARPQYVGGVVLYRVAGAAARCHAG